MPRTCVAHGCKQRHSKEATENGITFHSLPKDLTRRKQWVHAMRWDGYNPSIQDSLCSKHFEPECYKTGHKISILKRNAAPTLFDFPKHLQPRPCKERRMLNLYVAHETPSSPLGPLEDQYREKKIATAVLNDHGFYTLPSELYQIKKCVNDWRDKCESLQAKVNALRVKVCRKSLANSALKGLLTDIKNKKLLSEEDALALEEHFEGSKLTLVKSLLSKGKHATEYCQEARQFATTLHFYSPRAYSYLRCLFQLPSVSTLRSWVTNIHALPGFSQHALNYLKEKCASGDKTFQVAALVIDSMHLKQHIEYDQGLKRAFGYVDLGNLAEEDSEEVAKEALVIMLVGLRGHWKIPVAYYLVNGITASLQAGILRDTIIQCQNFNLRVLSITCDGTEHNIKSMKLLGASFKKDQLQPYFEHPAHRGTSVYVFLDPPHMIKLFRNLLHKFKAVKWPGHGVIRWEMLERLNNLQETHQLQLANKVTKRHINFDYQKMKVKLAVQCVASHSVACALRFCHFNSVPGFESVDVLATVDAVDLLDKTFDILNSRSVQAKGFKRAVVPSEGCIERTEEVFAASEAMLQSLEELNGTPLLDGRRKTGPMGLLSSIQVVRCLLAEMRDGILPLSYLLTYKLSQDHIELFFGCVRLRNGCAYNPTPRQFRSAFRKLLVHAGKGVVPTNGNCQAQDDTAVVTLPWRTASSVSDLPLASNHETSSQDQQQSVEMPHSGCFIRDCRVCCAVVAYIAGFVVRSVSERIPCADCISAMIHSEYDPCPALSLITIKNYKAYKECNSASGLIYPSGSVMTVALDTEKQLRSTSHHLSSKTCMATIIAKSLEKLANQPLFPRLNDHMFDAEGIESHFWLLMKSIIRRYALTRLKKMCSDKQMQLGKTGLGNKLQRTRIFLNA